MAGEKFCLIMKPYSPGHDYGTVGCIGLGYDIGMGKEEKKEKNSPKNGP